MKMILIDPLVREVTELEWDEPVNDMLRRMYGTLGVDLVDAVYVPMNDTV